MTILALDPATNCGWALGIWKRIDASGVWDLSIRRDESGGMRLIRLRSKIQEIYQFMPLDLVAFEAARNAGSKMHGALVVQAELQGVIKLWCEEHGIQYRGYSPSEIKKHATGKGNADKRSMASAARRKWTDRRIIDDNEADALWLLDLAQKEIG